MCVCARARVCTPAFPSKGWNAVSRKEGGGNGRPRVQNNTLLPPSTSACVCVHVSHRRVYVKGGCFENHGGARGGGKRGSYMPLSAFIRGLHALTLRCHALSPSTLPPFSLYPSFGVGSLRSHARQLTFRCRNRTFRHHHGI